MSDTIELSSPIYDSIAYNKVTPIVLASLGSLYVCIILLRYLRWRYRRRKAKKLRLYRQKLEKFWRKQLDLHQHSSQIQKPPLSHLAQQLPHSFESTATLVVSPGDNMSHSSSEHHVQIYPDLKEIAEEENDEKKQHKIHRKKDEWVGKVTSRLDGDRQKRKRRQLLWQWSVAMGYCRYNHGYQLNSLIDRLLENKTNHQNDDL